MFDSDIGLSRYVKTERTVTSLPKLSFTSALSAAGKRGLRLDGLRSELEAHAFESLPSAGRARGGHSQAGTADAPRHAEARTAKLREILEEVCARVPAVEPLVKSVLVEFDAIVRPLLALCKRCPSLVAEEALASLGSDAAAAAARAAAAEKQLRHRDSELASITALQTRLRTSLTAARSRTRRTLDTVRNAPTAASLQQRSTSLLTIDASFHGGRGLLPVRTCDELTEEATLSVEDLAKDLEADARELEGSAARYVREATEFAAGQLARDDDADGFEGFARSLAVAEVRELREKLEACEKELAGSRQRAAAQERRIQAFTATADKTDLQEREIACLSFKVFSLLRDLEALQASAAQRQATFDQLIAAVSTRYRQQSASFSGSPKQGGGPFQVVSSATAFGEEFFANSWTAKIDSRRKRDKFLTFASERDAARHARLSNANPQPQPQQQQPQLQQLRGDASSRGPGRPNSFRRRSSGSREQAQPQAGSRAAAPGYTRWSTNRCFGSAVRNLQALLDQASPPAAPSLKPGAGAGHRGSVTLLSPAECVSGTALPWPQLAFVPLPCFLKGKAIAQARARNLTPTDAKNFVKEFFAAWDHSSNAEKSSQSLEADSGRDAGGGGEGPDVFFERFLHSRFNIREQMLEWSYSMMAACHRWALDDFDFAIFSRTLEKTLPGTFWDHAQNTAETVSLAFHAHGAPTPEPQPAGPIPVKDALSLLEQLFPKKTVTRIQALEAALLATVFAAPLGGASDAAGQQYVVRKEHLTAPQSPFMQEIKRQCVFEHDEILYHIKRTLINSTETKSEDDLVQLKDVLPFLQTMVAAQEAEALVAGLHGEEAKKRGKAAAVAKSVAQVAKKRFDLSRHVSSRGSWFSVEREQRPAEETRVPVRAVVQAVAAAWIFPARCPAPLPRMALPRLVAALQPPPAFHNFEISWMQLAGFASPD
ncbi:hypothetical protein DIPPA_29008 [Diplonema papillatum]|nr:hypothetical protein DIPPA_29008 [Diplonema papillatum]